MHYLVALQYRMYCIPGTSATVQFVPGIHNNCVYPVSVVAVHGITIHVVCTYLYILGTTWYRVLDLASTSNMNVLFFFVHM